MSGIIIKKSCYLWKVWSPTALKSFISLNPLQTLGYKSHLGCLKIMDV